jgi:hypothetical protein
MALTDQSISEIGKTVPDSAKPDPGFDPCFLTGPTIDDYIKLASGDATVNDVRFRIFSGRPDWSKDAFSLALCEFLAYKSVLAYAEGKDILANLSNGNCRGIREEHNMFFASEPLGGDTHGFGFVLDETAFIVMRGTASLMDWIYDATALSTTSTWVRKKTRELIGNPSPPRHLGFARAWANVAPQIHQWAQSLPNEIPFCFSGHSLGGALAILGAHDFAKKDRNVAAVITFAAPKVGERDFAKEYEVTLNLKNRTLRLESDEDDVPWVAISRDYTPVGYNWWLDKRPMIGGWEKFWAALLGIAGWTREKPTGDAKPAETKLPASTGSDKKLEKDGSEQATQERMGEKEQKQTAADRNRALQVILVIAASIVIFLVTRKFIIRYRAHSASKRYALYLSTLSYRKIRELRSDDYDRASRELDAHLAYIRGKDASIYKDLKNRPIRITKKNAQQFRNLKGYERYIW